MLGGILTLTTRKREQRSLTRTPECAALACNTGSEFADRHLRSTNAATTDALTATANTDSVIICAVCIWQTKNGGYACC